MQKTPTIFLSYCRANADVADAIDNDFKRIGITFRRDIRDVAYRSNIKEFMNTIGESDFVLMLLSDEFLKSDWCMYEVTELLNTHAFHRKILPVVLNNANLIFKVKSRLTYYDYWHNLVKEQDRLIKKYPNNDLVEVSKRYKNVVNHLDNFFKTIIELNLLGIQDLKEQNYRPILDLVGFDDIFLLEEMLAIWQIEDQEDKEIALDNFGSKYPSNQYYLFSKAYFEVENKKFKKAKKTYEEALRIDPDYAAAHYNLGILLADQLADYPGAKTHYQEALRINPDYADAHYNLGILLKNNFADYPGAKTHYEEALRINPDDANTHYNLGNLLKNNFADYPGAKTHYQEALRINPDDANAHNNLGILLADQLADYPGAKTHFEEALRINPDDANTHYNLGILLKNNFADYPGAKTHYEEALRINPDYADAHYNLGILLADQLADYPGARTHFKEALRINPDDADAHIYLGILLADQLADYPGAKTHYQEALRINPDHASAHYNLASLFANNLDNNDMGKEHYITATRLDTALIDDEIDAYFGIER